MDKIGNRIKLKRLSLGMTQLELAKKMGYTSKAAISKVENNNYNLSMDRVKKFAEALDCTPSELLGWTKTQETPSYKMSPLKQSIINLVMTMNDDELEKLSQLLTLMFPELKEDKE